MATQEESLYGLKQAGRSWHHKIDAALHQVRLHLAGLRPLRLRQTQADSSIIALTLYVDDLLLAASDLAELTAFKTSLASEFKMEDLGKATFILGIELTRDRKTRTITITQTAYVKALLEDAPR